MRLATAPVSTAPAGHRQPRPAPASCATRHWAPSQRVRLTAQWRQQPRRGSGRVWAEADSGSPASSEAAAASPAPAAPQLSPAEAKQKLAELDKLLASDGPHVEAQAASLAATLHEQGALRAFGAANQVPKRAYTLQELRLNKIQPEQFLAPKDTTLSGVRNVVQGSYLAGLTAAYFGQLLDLSQIVQVVILTAFLLTVDQVANAGGFEALLVDTAGRVVSGTYGRRVALHEAGHFLIAYLLGLLPRGYTLSSLDLFIRKRQLNVQAGCQFCDSAFQAEVASGKLTSSSLDTYSCVALAGVATEWLRFGHAEGGLADVQQLDRLLQALRFTQAKADAQVRWSVLNVVTLLRRHEATHDALADAMSRGASVGECIAVIEQRLAGSSDI
ncbi:stress regulated isoform 3 [Chlorella sorokiniana]|uniref:Stress regulated isoform 3 n=1 Tax=Chlorella sorokiniana TaxID=3076 RepID=A0A2P6TZZ0_CHLSO|nr:stress regulated isoform 3 [Chlorella sorokiniana]|eukprot:PRW59629.1 stress regulated isoform 3 [Chlorella sorokiniana]